MSEKKPISIITNYKECPHKCWFCIFKNHKMNNVYGPTEESIKKFLIKYKNLGYNKFSISGSDVIFEQYTGYQLWWDNFHKICRELEFKYSIHTKSRIRFISYLKNDFLYKIVLSTEKLSDIASYIYWLQEIKVDKEIRIVKVIDDKTTKEDVSNYIQFAKLTDIQLTFKQLHGYNDNNNFKTYKHMFKNKYDKLVFLDDGDYNIYLMPDGKEYDKFIIE